MSYVKTEWINDQTPLNATNLNHIEDGIEAVPVDASVGRSSIVTKTSNIVGDVDRTNIANAPFSTALGSRIVIGANASESGAFGGDIHIDGENSYGFGYRVYGFRNQNLIGGYHIGSNAKESLVYGNEIVVDCDRLHVDDNPRHDVFIPSDTEANRLSRYLMVFGNDHTVGATALSDLIVGANHTIGDRFEYSIISGSGATIGDDVEFVNVFGGNNNRLDSNLTDCTVFGYSSHIYGGADSSNKVSNVYLFGDNNSNSKDDTINNAKSKVFLFGNHLRPLEDGQFIVGQYNKISSNKQPDAWFVVGSGSSEDHRRTSFAVCYNGTYGHHVYIGEKRLQEPTASGHVATEEYVGDIVGDINSALDAINGMVI